MRILYIGPGHSTIVRDRVAPFLDGVEARWVTTEPLPAAFQRAHSQVKQVLLPRPGLRRLPRRLFLHTLDYVVELNALVRRFRPDLIHLHYVSQLDALALLAVRRTPIVLTVMGADVLEDQVPRPAPLDHVVRALFRRATAVTAKSRFLAERCQALGTPLHRIHLIPWGVDTARFTPSDRDTARRELGLPLDAALLLSSRALTPLYNHDALLRGAVELGRARGAPPTLVFVRNAQDAGYATRIAEQARRLAVPACFLEPIPNDRMPLLYAAANACASLPASDGLPQTLLEALACERPTLALDLPAYRELPFAPDAMARIAHDHGAPRLGSLVAALHAALTPQERPGLREARAWIEANAERTRSLAAVRALYLAVAS